MSIASRGAVAGVLAALLLAATAGAAQQDLPEVTVQGQRDVFFNNEGKLVTLTRPVKYADLNLATPTGVDELQKRISELAKDVCHQLLTRYPDEVSGGFTHTAENCVQDATTNALKQANTVIAAVKSSQKAG